MSRSRTAAPYAPRGQWVSNRPCATKSRKVVLPTAAREKWRMFYSRVAFCSALAAVTLASAWPQTAAAQYFPYFRAGRRYAAVMGGPLGPAPLDPFSVAAYWGFLPAPRVARQTIGHEVIWTGPNGYVYRPVYADGDASGVAESDGFSVFPKTSARASNARGDGAAARGETAPVDLTPVNPKGLFDTALLLFRSGRYDEALGRIDQLLLADPDHGQAELLSAQALFALGEYPGAVSALDRATKRLGEDEWGRYVANYRDFFPSALRYAVHLRSLERFVDQFPEREESRLLLAYHYGSLGYAEQALSQLDLLRPNELRQRLREHFARMRQSAEDELPAPAPGPDMDEKEAPEDSEPIPAPQGEETRAPARRPSRPVVKRPGPREF